MQALQAQRCQGAQRIVGRGRSAAQQQSVSLLKEERQFVTVWGQPLWVQRSVKTQTQSPPGIGRVLGSGFFRCQTGEHVGHESPPSQGSLLGPSLLVQRECVAAPGQAQSPHQLSSNLCCRRMGVYGHRAGTSPRTVHGAQQLLPTAQRINLRQRGHQLSAARPAQGFANEACVFCQF